MAGRPHKGDRKLIATRPHSAVCDVISRRATTAGMTISQYVANVLAIHAGREDLVDEPPDRPEPAPEPTQQELPLSI